MISEFMKSLLQMFGAADLADVRQKPGWAPRNRSGRMKRTGGRGPGRHREGVARCQMQIARFDDPSSRDALYNSLKLQKTPDVSKFSEYRNGREFFCVAHN